MTSPTFLIQTFGCRVNQAESKQINDRLIRLGYKKAKKHPPDIIIINSCVITQKGERESARSIRALKKQYPNSFLIVTGCAANLWLNISKKNPLPPADLFLTNEKKSAIPQIVTKHTPPPQQIQDLSIQKRLTDPGSPRRVFVKIQDGCNHFCSYCIVPYLRTKPTSKKVNQIIKEINQAYRVGAKEAILCGINLSSFGQDLNQPTTLTDLIEKILKKTKIPRLSLSSLTPNLINKKLIDIFIADQEKDQRLSSYWHLALQSGSETVLKRMNRPANLNKLSQSLQYIKQALPYFTLRADIIIGFPDETDKEFSQTLDFIANNKISFGHLFPYSPRPKTKAQKMISQGAWDLVPDKVKKTRRKNLLFVLEKNRQKEAKKLINSQRLVLTLKSTSYCWWGLSDNYWPTKIMTSGNNIQKKLGQIIPVKITGQEGKTLRGNFINTN